MEENEQIHNKKKLEFLRKKLRRHLTPAEARLWSYLKAGALEGRKFRRQHSVEKHILDFYCPSEKLAIELDGETHYGPIASELDAERTNILNSYGIRVLRFENRTVFEAPEAMLARIRQHFRG